MKTLKMVVELKYEDDMHGSSPEEMSWFLGQVLGDKVGLLLHSNCIGDTVGTVHVLEFIE
jgi:hypothetical protein